METSLFEVACGMEQDGAFLSFAIVPMAVVIQASAMTEVYVSQQAGTTETTSNPNNFTETIFTVKAQRRNPTEKWFEAELHTLARIRYSSLPVIMRIASMTKALARQGG